MSDTWIGLIGTLIGAAIGAGITLLTESLRRRWDRSDKWRTESVIRAEELAGIAQQLFEWQSTCFSDAVRGDVKYLPSTVFRMGILVSAYFPALESRATDLGKAISAVHSACAVIALHVQKNHRSAVPLEMSEAAKVAMNGLNGVCVRLTEDVGRLLRDTRPG